MRSMLALSALAVASAATLVPISARVHGESQAAGGPLAPLAFLSGCWERRTATRLVEEQWMRPRGSVMLGTGRTVRGDSVVEYEQLRIASVGGEVAYHAQPSGQPPATFRLARMTDTSVAFENPAHDFPQRISYRAVGRDSLIARVEGTMGGRSRAIDFPYARAACPG